MLYSQNYFCDTSVSSKASSKCEAGAKYKKLPPGTAAGAIDPLYIPTPLGFTPEARRYVQCQATPMCIDHPATVDLSRIAAALPGAPVRGVRAERDAARSRPHHHHPQRRQARVVAGRRRRRDQPGGVDRDHHRQELRDHEGAGGQAGLRRHR